MDVEGPAYTAFLSPKTKDLAKDKAKRTIISVLETKAIIIIIIIVLHSHVPSKIADMPRSKRARAVHLSKTTKKGKELTLKLHAAIQECIPKFPYIYIFRVENMRNTYLKDVRNKLSDSR